MTLEQELELSYFQQVADIDPDHSIYLVQDLRDRQFYVKKLLTVYNSDIYRYLQEHPIANTPRIYFVQEHNGILTVIEEYIPGETLESILSEKRTLPEAQALHIISELCVILSDFHRCSPAIVNRDIKPSNIKITPDNVVKLLDMNAAKWSNTDAEKDTVLLGTQGYAAPEQYGFGPSSVLSDIYAVGVLLNVMLCGTFPGKKIADGPSGKLIRKCVELSPSARYQSISQLQSALAQLVKTEPTFADPKTNWKTFLPPGFRSKNPMRHTFSLFGYSFLFYLGLSLSVENAEPAVVILNRISFIATLLSIVLFNGNYLGIQKHFVLTRSPRRRTRWLGMAIVDFVFAALWITLLNIVVLSFFDK